MNEEIAKEFYPFQKRKQAFMRAFESNLFEPKEPYMYMGEDEKAYYFKHKITRKYLNLVK